MAYADCEVHSGRAGACFGREWSLSRAPRRQSDYGSPARVPDLRPFAITMNSEVAAIGPDSKKEVHPFDVGWRERLAVLGGVAALLLTLILVGLQTAPDQTLELLGLAPITFVAIGKFLPLWGISGQSSLGPYQLGIGIWALDTLTVIVFVYSFEAVYRIPFARRALDKIHHNMKLLLGVYPRMKRLSLVGVFLFVLFPISGTGALAGSFIGMLLGAHRASLIMTVSLGGCFGGMIMAFLASNFGGLLTRMQAAQSDSTVQYILLAGLVALIAAFVIWLGRAYRRVLAEAELVE